MSLTVNISQFAGGEGASPVTYPFDIWDGAGKTIVYKIGNGGAPPHFSGSYSFNPEGWATMNGKLYSFLNGNFYLHNQTSNYNQFYGVQYKSKVMCISNAEPNSVKTYNSLSLECNFVPSLSYFMSQSPYQQVTDIMDYEWQNLEGMLYAPIKRNKLLPTATGYTTTSLLTGQKIQSYYLYIMLEFTISNTPLELRFVNLIFDKSRGHATA